MLFNFIGLSFQAEHTTIIFSTLIWYIEVRVYRTEIKSKGENSSISPAHVN